MSRRLIIIFIAVLVLAVSVSADIQTVTRTFKEKVGPFHDSKNFTKTVNMPFNLKNQGYVFISRSVVTRGDARVRNESLTGDTFRFTMRISKSFFESAKGEVIVTLQAQKGGNAGWVGPSDPAPGLPQTPTPNPGTTWGDHNPNQAPDASYPSSGQVFIIDSKNDRIHFRWSDPLQGKEFKVRIYTANGHKVKEKVIRSKSYSVRVDNKFPTGGYKWQVARNNRAGFLTDIPLIGGAFADWSNYTTPNYFEVERRDNNHNNDYPYNPTYPSGGHSPSAPQNQAAAPDLTSPSRDQTIPAGGNVQFAWTGSGNRFQVEAFEFIGNNIVTRTVNSNSLSVPASTFPENRAIKWRVKSFQNNKWSDYSPISRFRVVPSRQSMKEAVEAQYDMRDNELAGQRLETLESDSEFGAQATLMRADTLMDDGNYSEAIKTLQKLLGKESAEKQALLKLANCYIELGNKGMAKIYAEKLISEYPGSPEAAQAAMLLR